MMEFGTLTLLVLSLVGAMAQTPCAVPCSRPNGFNPNLMNPTVICPSQEEHILNINLIKIVLRDMKNLAHQSKKILAARLEEDNLSDVHGVHLPNVQDLSTIGNMASLQTMLHDHMLIFNVIIERVQWTQKCLFKLQGQINTISSHVNMIRASILTNVCLSWDGQRNAAKNIDINYLDRQSKHMENRLAYFAMKRLHDYANGMIHKIESLQS